MKALILKGWHVLVVGGLGKAAGWPNCDDCHMRKCLSEMSMDECVQRVGHGRCHGFHAARDPHGDPDGWDRLYRDLKTPSEKVLIPGEASVHLRTGRVSRVLVVDVDGTEGMESLRMILRDRTRPLPDTLVAQTPSGGCHYFYEVEGAGNPLRTRPGGIGRKIDLKADGGYVVLPPSEKRRWEVAPGSLPIAPCPEWLLRLSEDLRGPGNRRYGYQDEAEEYLSKGPVERNALRESYQEGLTRLSEMSPDSGRNTALHRLACRLYSLVHLGGITRTEADAPLWSAAKKCGLADPANRRQTERTLQSAWDWTSAVSSQRPQE